MPCGNTIGLDANVSKPTPSTTARARDAIVVVWTPPVVQDVALHTLGGAGGLVANLRSQILARGLPGLSAFCRGVRDAAVVGIGNVREIDQEAFCSAADAAAAELTVSSRLVQSNAVGGFERVVVEVAQCFQLFAKFATPFAFFCSNLCPAVDARVKV